jgi:SAM-dependent methyltransferase
VSPKYSNFHFQYADIYNKSYNPTGKYEAARYRFPYQDESFDSLIAKSLFTHMLERDMDNYFSEIYRVLRKDGRCLVTFFLLNSESKKLIYEGKSTQEFIYDLGGCCTTNKSVPEEAIAYNEELIRSIYEDHGLGIVEPIHLGSWCGRPSFLIYQDLVLGYKPQSTLTVCASRKT